MKPLISPYLRRLQSKKHTSLQLGHQVCARRESVNAKLESVEADADASKPKKHVPVHVPATETAKPMPRVKEKNVIKPNAKN
jgi:hypothetical protein